MNNSTFDQELELERKATECGVPNHIIDGLVAYIVGHREPGGFLLAVLTNDLIGACARADDINRHKLFDIVSFLYNHAPGSCWGSDARVTDWIAPRKDVRQ